MGCTETDIFVPIGEEKQKGSIAATTLKMLMSRAAGSFGCYCFLAEK